MNPMRLIFGNATPLTLVLAASSFLLAGALAANAEPDRLTVAAESPEMIWNAVAVEQERIFVAGPRWTGSRGPAVAVIGLKGETRPYPDGAWNAWLPGADASHSFINANAIHLDGKGSLWVVDTGSPEFGGDPLPDGPKLVKIDLASNRVTQVIPVGPDIAMKGSYVDDIRFHGNFAYLTDAGRPGLVVVDLASGAMRRVLDDHVATRAPTDRPIIVDRRAVSAPDGSLLRVHSDPMEISPDGLWLYFAPLEGPWSKVETRWLDDFTVAPATIAQKVDRWADLPPVGGTAIDAQGNLYFTDLASNALRRRAPDGTIDTIIQDARLHWVDAPFIDEQRQIWLPVPQMDRTAIFNSGRSKVEWPVRLYKLQLPDRPGGANTSVP